MSVVEHLPDTKRGQRVALVGVAVVWVLTYRVNGWAWDRMLYDLLRFGGPADLVTPGSVDHDAGPGQGPGPAGYQAFFTEMRTAFPDLHVEVEHVTAAEEDVAFAHTRTGTHAGPFQGRADGLEFQRPGRADQPFRGRPARRAVGEHG